MGNLRSIACMNGIINNVRLGSLVGCAISWNRSDALQEWKVILYQEQVHEAVQPDQRDLDHWGDIGCLGWGIDSLVCIPTNARSQSGLVVFTRRDR